MRQMMHEAAPFVHCGPRRQLVKGGGDGRSLLLRLSFGHVRSHICRTRWCIAYELDIDVGSPPTNSED